MEIKKYAAVDIGSNGVRLLISNILMEQNHEPIFRKSSLVRVPIRLGADTFETGNISERNINRMKNAMLSFKLLMDINDVEKYRAYATSALREAKNGKKVIDFIRKETEINIEIIDGKTEAEIISSTDLFQNLNPDKDYLYVDVGGGSTELTYIKHGIKVASKSFKIGTVRLLNEQYTTDEIWKSFKTWIEKTTKKSDELTVVGSGGNIVRVYKMGNTGIGKPISLNYITKQYRHIKSLSYNERIKELGLNPDRADVIIPALEIYIAAMKWSRSEKMMVPKIGLADGIIKTMFAAYHS